MLVLFIAYANNFATCAYSRSSRLGAHQLVIISAELLSFRQIRGRNYHGSKQGSNQKAVRKPYSITNRS